MKGVANEMARSGGDVSTHGTVALNPRSDVDLKSKKEKPIV